MIVALNPPPRNRVSRPVKSLDRKTKFTKADVIRAVDAVQARGLLIAEVQISVDGSIIRLVTTNGRGGGSDDLFSRWEHRL